MLVAVGNTKEKTPNRKVIEYISFPKDAKYKRFIIFCVFVYISLRKKGLGTSYNSIKSISQGKEK